MSEPLNPELERRIRALENPAELGAGFTSRDWIYLILLGVVLPLVSLIWGWAS